MLPGSQRTRTRPDGRRWSGAALGLVLLTVLVAVNGLAIWGIVSARSSARAAARADLELQTQVHARSFEALLANLRADLMFVSQSPPIAELPGLAERSDPMERRWLRLNGEATLLLFLSANPAVELVQVEGPGGEALLVAGRRQGAPQILPKEEPAGSSLDPAEAAASTEPSGWLRGSWPVGGTEGARLRAWVEPGSLLKLAAPGSEERLRLEPVEPPPLPLGSDLLSVAVPVADDQWTPAVAGWLVRQEEGGQVVRSFEALSRRYRTTLIVNLAVILLTLALAGVAYRQVRHTARLEAEREQQERVRELERRLMHSERLASVGRLAAGLAHEINNPLEGMSNFLAVLEEDLAAGDLEGARGWTPKLRQGLERSAAVTRQVLTYSDPGRAPKTPVDLVPVISEAVDFVASNPSFGDVDVLWEPEDAEMLISANRTTLGQLFLNLLLNACEAEMESSPEEMQRERKKTAEGKGVQVTLGVEGDDGPAEASSPRRAHRWAVVAVADRGPGFTGDALDHLFEPFYSGRGSSGLGLAVCHGIVQDLGGRITAANRPGGGAQVRVELPLPVSQEGTEKP